MWLSVYCTTQSMRGVLKPSGKRRAPPPSRRAVSKNTIPKLVLLYCGTKYSYFYILFIFTLGTIRLLRAHTRIGDVLTSPPKKHRPYPHPSPHLSPRTLTRALEETLCREVASVAAAFEMRSSKWNGSVGEGRAVFEVPATSLGNHSLIPNPLDL